MHKIGQNILNNHIFLKKLAKTSSDRKRTRLLRLATSEELLSIIEIAYNILKNRFPLTKRQRSLLIPHADIIRKIGRVRTERGVKKVIQTIVYWCNRFVQL